MRSRLPRSRDERRAVDAPRVDGPLHRGPRPSAADTVLVLTHSGDHYVTERVAEALESAGARVARFDTDRFPLEARLAARLGPGASAHRLRCDDLELDLERVRAVW